MTARREREFARLRRRVYEGAPHSFFDRASAEWRAACDDAWRRVEDFTGRLAA